MYAKVKDMLAGIPQTGPGVKVVPIDGVLDPDKPPGGLHTTWRAIKQRQRVIEDLHARKLQLEHDLAVTTAAAHQAIARAEREIAEETAKQGGDQARWIIMTRDLGIDIQDDPQGVE